MPARPAKPAAKGVKPLARRHPKANPEAFFTAAQAAAARAARDDSATPCEVREAFAPESLAVGDLALRTLSWADFILLEKLESPFADSSIAGGAEVAQMDVAFAVFILTRPALEANDLYSAKGRAALEREALALAARVPLAQLNALGIKLREAFARAFATVIEGEKKTAP